MDNTALLLQHITDELTKQKIHTWSPHLLQLYEMAQRHLQWHHRVNHTCDDRCNHIYDHARVIWWRTQATDVQRGQMLKRYDELQQTVLDSALDLDGAQSAIMAILAALAFDGKPACPVCQHPTDHDKNCVVGQALADMPQDRPYARLNEELEAERRRADRIDAQNNDYRRANDEIAAMNARLANTCERYEELIEQLRLLVITFLGVSNTWQGANAQEWEAIGGVRKSFHDLLNTDALSGLRSGATLDHASTPDSAPNSPASAPRVQDSDHSERSPTERLADVLNILHDIEWACHGQCPVCGALERIEAHSATCALARVLTESNQS